MSAIAELIRRADERLHSQVSVAAGLAEAVTRASLDDVPDTDEALVAARKLLAERKTALAEAQRRVRQLEETVTQLSRALPFLEANWPWQRDLLLKAVGGDSAEGLAEWLNYWFAAASSRRLGALRRLQFEVPLPDRYGVIGERLAVAARALGEDDWVPCREILLTGAAGVRVGSREIPDRPAADGHEPDVSVREDLRLLAARLALHNGRYDEAGVILGSGQDTSAARLALRSRLARLRGADADAESLLARARALDPADLDVATESIRQVRKHRDADAAVGSARAAVETLASLADVEGDVGRLVSPPAELWIALAERAREEADHGAARAFLDRVAGDDNEVRAAAAEVGATVAASDAERHRALLLAGYWRARAGQLDRARRDYEAATAGAPADPADAEAQAAARLRLADVIAVTARQRPYRAVEKDLDCALDLVRGARPRRDWSYLTETDLRIQLSRVPGREDGSRQEWAALLAAATAVSVRPEWAASWLALAEAALTRDLYLVAEAAAARAHQVEPDNEATTAGYVRALVNTGRYAEALGHLGDTDDPDSSDYLWRQCIRGLIALRQGKAGEAADCYGGLSIDPAWLWAWNASVRALVITGRLDAARQKSAELRRMGAGREDERSWLAVAAFDARLNGQLGAAGELAGRLSDAAGAGDFRARYARAEAQLLGGDPAGWDLLVQALTADPRPAAVDVWEREELPVLRALAESQGMKLTAPAGLDSAIGKLRAGERPKGPVAELWQAVKAVKKAAQADAAKNAVADEAQIAAEAVEAALLTAMLASQPAETRLAAQPPPAPLLRLPTSWLAGNAERNLDSALREWVARRMELSGAEELEPDGYQLLADGKIGARGHLGRSHAATAAGLLAGGHQLSRLETRPSAEVIAAAYYSATPSGNPLPVTVSWLAHRIWVLRGMPTGTERADWDLAEYAFRKFVDEHAYFRWEKRGGPLFGDTLADWFPAEQEIAGKGISPGTVVDERLRWMIALQTA